MRGGVFPELSEDYIKAVLMSRYNQQYSELDDMSYKTVVFLLRLAENEDIYIKQKINQAKAKSKGKSI